MNTNNRIKNRRQELNLTLEDVAKHVGVSKTTVSRWETGEISNIRRDKIGKLAEILKVKPNFIMGLEESSTSQTLTVVELVDIPLYGKASAGNGYLNLDIEIGTYAIPKDIFKKNIFSVKVSGDSMTGVDKNIPDGAIAVVDPDLCLEPYSLNGKVCVFEYNDEIYIKQLIIDSQGIIHLRSFNTNYEDIIVLKPETLICKGRVVRTFIDIKW